MNMIIKYVYVVIVALTYALRYQKTLAIKPTELPTYLQKTCNLALCYIAFTLKGSLKELRAAAKCGFLCCAYDVVTDWRYFALDSFKRFCVILHMELPPNLAQMTIALYENEKNDSLLFDGLERGRIAVYFITSVIGSKDFFEANTDLARLGILLQIVDDILDYDIDIKTGDLNCLTSPRKFMYLHSINQELSDGELHNLFGINSILTRIVKKAKRVARLMLNSTRAIQDRPHQTVP